MFEYIKNWLAGIHTNYGVNPIIFSIIYLAAAPFFWFSIYKIMSGLKNRKPGQIRVFGVILGIAIIAPFVYVAAFGRNLPVWFWLFAGAIIGYSIFSTVKKIRSSPKKTASTSNKN